MLTDPRTPDLPEWLHELYPFRTRLLDLGDQRMSFVDEGPADAPPLVLLHGNPTWSFLYRDLVRRAREQHRVIAPDNVGFGLSDKPLSPAYHTLERHILNLARLVEVLGLRNLTLVVNGWGGPIGLGYAVAFPGNVARLVLTNTWAGNFPPMNVRRPVGVRLAAKGRLGAWLDALLNLSMHSVFSSRTYRPIGDLAMEGYMFPFPSAPLRAGVLAFTRMFFEPDGATVAKLAEVQAGLKEIQAPAEILFGARDPVLSKLPAYLLRDDLRHASEPQFLPEVAHYLPEEDPEALARVVLREAAPAPATGSENVFKIIG